MGYYIKMTDSDFVINKENFEKALKSLKGVFIPKNMTCCDRIGDNRIPHFRWVDTKTVLDSTNLGEALEEIRYIPKFNQDGDICDVEFTGEKYGDEEIFFNALAPYVKTGSYLAFEGEDGAAWKWVFDEEKVKNI